MGFRALTPEPAAWSMSTLDWQSPPPIAHFQNSFLLMLFFNIGNESCKESALPISRQLWHRYPDLNIIGIHVQAEHIYYLPNQVRYVTEKKEIPFPVYQDHERKTFEKFRATCMPYWVLLDRSGNPIKSIEGSQPDALKELSFALEVLFYSHYSG